MRQEPHAAQHERSISIRAQRGVMPRNLPALLAWYRAEWSSEIPARLHHRGVEWDGPGAIVREDFTVEQDRGGGSLIGTPRLAGEWRAYLFGSPKRVDEDGSYILPIHAALALMAGRNVRSPSSFMARFLLALALADFDWRRVCLAWHIREEVGWCYTEVALARLWVIHADQTGEQRSAA